MKFIIENMHDMYVAYENTYETFHNFPQDDTLSSGDRLFEF